MKYDILNDDDDYSGVCVKNSSIIRSPCTSIFLYLKHNNNNVYYCSKYTQRVVLRCRMHAVTAEAADIVSFPFFFFIISRGVTIE